MHKTCTTCHETKPLDTFTKNASRPDGRGPQCQSCRNAVSLAWRNRNLEKARASLRTWQAAHRAETAAERKAWRQAHPEEARQRDKDAYAKNRDKRRAQARERQRRKWQDDYAAASAAAIRYYRANTARIIRAHRLHLQAHPEINRRNHALRRARRHAAPIVEYVDLDIIFARDKGVCSLCHRPVARADACRDHIIPLTKGGEESYRNVALAHVSCNSRKNNRAVTQQMRLF